MASTRCWQCNRPLRRHPQTGRLVYEEVSMPMGAMSVRVHKICKADAEIAAGVAVNRLSGWR